MTTAALVIMYKDQLTNEYYVFVHQRSFTTHCGGQGMLGVPGGHCDPSDQGDPVRTVLRETVEECGYQFRARGTPIVLPMGPKSTHTDILLMSDMKWNGEPVYLKSIDETVPTFTNEKHRHQWVKVRDLLAEGNGVKDVRGVYVQLWHRTKSSVNNAIMHINFLDSKARIPLIK